MGEIYSGIRALADFIHDVTKYQQKSGLLWAMTEVREAALSIKDIPVVCRYSDFFPFRSSWFASRKGVYL